VLVPSVYHPDLPLPLRVEILDGTGKRLTDPWDQEARVSLTGAGASVSPGTFHVYNGAGNVLLKITGSGQLTLRVWVGALSAERTLTRLDSSFYNPPQEITGTETWSPGLGVVRLSGKVRVAPGALLRIEPGTVVAAESKAGIVVEGKILCEGTAEQPVLFASAGSDPWGEIRHVEGSQPSEYRFTFFCMGGDSSGAGHTGRGPVVRLIGSEASFENCAFLDSYGKCVWAEGGSRASFVWCHFSRSAMGMEVTSTALSILWCAFLEFPGTSDAQDNDALYLHGGSPDLIVKDSIFALGGDDGIDTLGSDPLIERCIVRDFADKGVSIFHGAPSVRRCIIADNDKGVSAKGDDTHVEVDHCTIVGNPISLEIKLKYNTHQDDEIWLTVTNTIAWETEKGVRSDYPPQYIKVRYSDLGGEFYARVNGEVVRYPQSAVYPGEGNISEDPRFLDLEARKLELTASSPCRDSGDPQAAPDPDGSRSDMGALPFLQAAPPGSFVRGEVNGDRGVDLSDAVEILRHLFAGLSLHCIDAADVNDSGAVDLADAVSLLSYLFAGGMPPPPPFPTCGLDPTEDPLDCSEAPACNR